MTTHGCVERGGSVGAIGTTSYLATWLGLKLPTGCILRNKQPPNQLHFFAEYKMTKVSVLRTTTATSTASTTEYCSHSGSTEYPNQTHSSSLALLTISLMKELRVPLSPRIRDE